MKKHRTLIIGIGIVLGVGWFILMLYALSAERAPQTEVNPGAIAAASVKQHAEEEKNTPTPTVKMTRIATPSPIRHHVAPPAVSNDLPKAQMGSVSMRIHETSNATVQHIGSGMASTYGATTSNGKSSSRGVHSTALAYSGAIYIPMTNNAITSVGATEAGDLASQKMGIAARRMKKTDDGVLPGYNEDPVPDEDAPIGNIAWGLMLLLAAAYVTMLGVRRFRREEK